MKVKCAAVVDGSGGMACTRGVTSTSRLGYCLGHERKYERTKEENSQQVRLAWQRKREANITEWVPLATAADVAEYHERLFMRAEMGDITWPEAALVSKMLLNHLGILSVVNIDVKNARGRGFSMGNAG